MAGRPLLARRRLIGSIVAVAVVATAILGVRYGGMLLPGRIDVAIDVRVDRHLGAQRGTLQHLVALVNPVTVGVACSAMCILFVALGRRRLAALAVLGPATTVALVDYILKPLFERRFHGSLSFPSGHTAIAVAIAVVVIVALFGPSRPPWPIVVRALAATAATVGAAIVATALVGGGYHYATDTMGGLCVAVASVLSVALLIDAVAGRRGAASAEPEGAVLRVGA